MRLSRNYVISDRVRVDFVDLNEGYVGDYDPENPADKKLLRFDVKTRKLHKKWEDLEDGSYCTTIPVNTPDDDLKWVLLYMCSTIIEAMEKGYSLKRTCERLSWITPTSIEVTKFKIGNLLLMEVDARGRKHT